MKILQLSDPQHGWIEITFGEPPVTFTETVSEVPNDCLRDLAAATARLLRNSTQEVVEFSLEPAYLVCNLRRESDQVRIVLTRSDSSGTVFEATCPLRAFAGRVRSELLRIQSRYSADDGWTQPFPEREVANLT